ncbi:hypothetical protein [Haematospirillum sp. H1815]|uniref:hypothetical protein n=1 Tax=Haematospirillum sp. H1815 TaxID=2723108 RepID=UPI00143C752A|nr:hypothetical protein [Haematospirillum sp. H1815]
MSPAYPAAFLLFGLMFVMALAHFLSLPWSRSVTVAFYLFSAGWCLLILRDRIGLLKRLNAIDVGFAGFVLAVLVSGFIFPGLDEHGSVSKYIRFIPFMMMMPYVLGRLMMLRDMELLSRITLLLCLALLPLLLLDRLTVVERPWRLPVFGLDHGPLIVSGLLAAALLALCVRVLTLGHQANKDERLRRLVLLAIIGCVTVVLVGIMGRAWLLGGMAAVAVVSLAAGDRPLAQRMGLLAYVLAIAMLALFFLPVSAFYALVLPVPVPVPVPITATDFGPILGEASCQPFKDGIDSVAMRWVMYREAWAMFMQNQFWGVGVARFGDFSCTGPGWYPHSTILQGFAELGLIGGGLQIGLFLLTAGQILQSLLLTRQARIEPAHVFVAGLFVLFLVSDQFYGTYLMAAGAWLVVGIAASLRANAGGEPSRA